MINTDLLPGISSTVISTPRLKTHILTAGPQARIPVIFIHGNVSSARFWEETMLILPAAYRSIAVDLRGFGQSETKSIDARRGLRDFSDDLHSLIETLSFTGVHLVGWSVGGSVAMQYAIDHAEQVASLTLIAPMSPYGFGGTKDAEGTACWSDYAGSGGGTANPEFIKRLAEGDQSDESNFSPRKVMNAFYFSPPFTAAPNREEVYLEAMLNTQTGEGNYPGSVASSENWPMIAPGTIGMNNAISPKYCNLSHFAKIDPQPPVLWIRGDSDQIVSDTSVFDLGFLGELSIVPGWPGAEVYPPQPMITQTRAVLDAYQSSGGRYSEEVIVDCGHSPHVEKPEEFQNLLLNFLGSSKI